MENCHEKRRDMARSILPSKNRKPAREAIARTKRANRRAIRQELALLGAPHRTAPSADDHPHRVGWDEWDERRDLRRYPWVEIRFNVRWRRDGDKLNHFIRWAIVTTAHLPVDDRLPHLRAIVGGGLIGNHAMNHLEREAELRTFPEHDRRHRRLVRLPSAAEREAALAAELEVLRTLVHGIVAAPGGLKRFNRHLKSCDRHQTRDQCRAAGCVTRCLAGQHDVEAFLLDVRRPLIQHGDAPLSQQLPHRRLRSYLRELDAAATLVLAHREIGR